MLCSLNKGAKQPYIDRLVDAKVRGIPCSASSTQKRMLIYDLQLTAGHFSCQRQRRDQLSMSLEKEKQC